MTERPLGHEVVDASLPISIPWVPVLHCAVLDFCILGSRQLHNSRMQLQGCTNRGVSQIDWLLIISAMHTSLANCVLQLQPKQSLSAL